MGKWGGCAVSVIKEQKDELQGHLHFRQLAYLDTIPYFVWANFL